jgi:hypothetical protein
MEWRKNKNQFVAYSLGNYVSGQRKRYTDGGALAYIELEKVTFDVDSAVTTIDSAAYYLHWVHRTVDANKDYFMLPVPDDKQNLAFIKDDASRTAYKLFVSDSRALYAKHNVNVKEITTRPMTKESEFRVLLSTTQSGEDPWNILTSQQPYLWGVDRVEGADGKVFWFSGKFTSKEKAEQYRDRYKEQHPEAAVVEFRNGLIVQ